MASNGHTGVELVATMVERGIERCRAALAKVLREQPASDEGKARRCERVADLYEREARWWWVLSLPTFCSDLPDVYGVAVHGARAHSLRSAERYREYAQQWADRAAQRAAGAGVAA